MGITRQTFSCLTFHCSALKPYFVSKAGHHTYSQLVLSNNDTIHFLACTWFLSNTGHHTFSRLLGIVPEEWSYGERDFAANPLWRLDLNETNSVYYCFTHQRRRNNFKSCYFWNVTCPKSSLQLASFVFQCPFKMYFNGYCAFKL